jgi:hypothetical protein
MEIERGDTVHHGPTGEDWVVKRAGVDSDGAFVEPAGWPPCRARAADCTLIAKGVMEWQPIETAPKDGTDVLLWVPDGTYFSLMMTGSYEGEDMGWCDNARGSPGFDPTHWMPLPPPPTE